MTVTGCLAELFSDSQMLQRVVRVKA